MICYDFWVLVNIGIFCLTSFINFRLSEAILSPIIVSLLFSLEFTAGDFANSPRSAKKKTFQKTLGHKSLQHQSSNHISYGTSRHNSLSKKILKNVFPIFNSSLNSYLITTGDKEGRQGLFVAIIQSACMQLGSSGLVPGELFGSENCVVSISMFFLPWGLQLIPVRPWQSRRVAFVQSLSQPLLKHRSNVVFLTGPLNYT